jgi:hypothetical protein
VSIRLTPRLALFTQTAPSARNETADGPLARLLQRCCQLQQFNLVTLMTSTFFRTLSALAITAAATAAQATPVSIGALSSNDDGSTTLIEDTLNNREWLRWDTSKTMNYAQTLAAIGAGGALAGFHIANNADAQQFVLALHGSVGNCDLSNNAYCATDAPANYVGLVGDSYVTGVLDYVWFLSDNSAGVDVGLIELSSSSILKYNEWAAVANADYWSTSAGNANSIGWLLYRDSSDTGNKVPEPASIALTLLALAGAAAARRRA